jgi:hypothetical protein
VQEQKAAQDAGRQISRLYIEFFEDIFIILLITCILSYLVQIAADILQAHIDNADNSFPRYVYPTDTEAEKQPDQISSTEGD